MWFWLSRILPQVRLLRALFDGALTSDPARLGQCKLVAASPLPGFRAGDDDTLRAPGEFVVPRFGRGRTRQQAQRQLARRQQAQRRQAQRRGGREERHQQRPARRTRLDTARVQQ